MRAKTLTDYLVDVGFRSSGMKFGLQTQITARIRRG